MKNKEKGRCKRPLDTIVRQIPKDEWEHCPNCSDCGVKGCQLDWWWEGSEYEYEQCEFCFTNPKSVYYQTNKLWQEKSA